MRYSRSLIPTLKENPADAEVVSHKLMVRAGMLRQVARGIYDLLPLGLRVVRKVERIVREEMNRAGAQEILMPTICPAELWQETGRWDHYGKELLRVRDRSDRDFCYGPTHEEVVTDIVRREVRSYRDLPLNLYQIQSKFRDEVRPRFGLMRGREFLMKDAYSFHVDYADCEREYRVMSEAYTRIFTRCGLKFRPVEAATGAIGGSMSHEFHVLAESGEDALVSCERCGYAANVEQAAIPAVPPPVHAGALKPMTKVATPGQRTVEEVSAFLGVPSDRFIKTLLVVTDSGETVAALVRGDHTLSEAKLLRALGAAVLTMADAATVEKTTGAAVGFAGPVGLAKVRILADQALRGIAGAVAGANETDQHLVDVAQERDLPKLTFADLRTAEPGDPCPRCPDGIYEGHRGIEVGQVFYLGTKYSKAMGATYLDANGGEQVMEMGCYGIGITRTAAAAIEQNHDDNGIMWPLALAPAHVHLIAVNPKDEAQRQAAESLYRDLQAAGVEVLYDDRDERPGVKFKDADLIGIPFRVTVGPRALARGAVEFKPRRAAQVEELPLADAVGRLVGMVREGDPA
ncbi:MAG TPA: proline--tRNA ligase [Candidatus Dormibacteraeota bacterium]|nr:proline--tRNA ligase [Candidatus Dormibacteraeota bacterium]